MSFNGKISMIMHFMNKLSNFKSIADKFSKLYHKVLVDIVQDMNIDSNNLMDSSMININ